MNATHRFNFTDCESMDMEIIKLFKLDETQIVVQQLPWCVITCCFWLPAFFVNSLLVHLARTRVSLHSVSGVIAMNMAAAYNVMLVFIIPQLLLQFVNIPTFVIYLSHSSVVLVTSVIVPTTIVIHALERQHFICNALSYSAPFWWIVVLTTLILSWITTVFTTIFFVTERTWVPSQTMQQIISVSLCFVAFIVCVVCHARIGIKSFQFLTLSEHTSWQRFQNEVWKNDLPAPGEHDITNIPKFADIVSPRRASCDGSTVSNTTENELVVEENETEEVNTETSNDNKQLFSTTVTSTFAMDNESAVDDEFRERRSSLFYQKPVQVSMPSTLPGFVQESSDEMEHYLTSSLGTQWDPEEIANELSLSIAGILSKNKHFPKCSALSDLMTRSLDFNVIVGHSNKRPNDNITDIGDKNIRASSHRTDNVSSINHSAAMVSIPGLGQSLCKQKHPIIDKIRGLETQHRSGTASKLDVFGISTAKEASCQSTMLIQTCSTVAKAKSNSQSIGECTSHSRVNIRSEDIAHSFDGVDSLDTVDISEFTISKLPKTRYGKRTRRVRSISAWMENTEGSSETEAHTPSVPRRMSNPVISMVGMDVPKNKWDQKALADDSMAKNSVETIDEAPPKSPLVTQSLLNKDEDCQNVSKECTLKPSNANSLSYTQGFGKGAIRPPGLQFCVGVEQGLLDSHQSKYQSSSKIFENKTSTIHGRVEGLGETQAPFSTHHDQEQGIALSSFGGSFLSFADMLNQSQFSGIGIFLERNDIEIKKTDIDVNTKKKLIILKSTSPPLLVTFYFFSLIPIIFALTHESIYVMDIVNLNKSILALLHPLMYVFLDAHFRDALATLLFNFLHIKMIR